MKCKRALLACALLLCLVQVPVTAAGGPVAENLELETYRDTPLSGQLRATDPNGGGLTYTVTTPPVKGTVTLNDDGSFLYTPEQGRRGKDYFGYTATDSTGAVSQEATVIITLRKQKTDVRYDDQAGQAWGYHALRLAEAGVFTGERIGSRWLFSPGLTVSRGELLAMCMELSDRPILTGVSTTGFADDDTIPLWQKGYVATALMHGLVEDAGSFDAAATVTVGQAAVMMRDVLGISGAAPVSATEADDTARAMAELRVCRVVTGEAADDLLTRETAAMMLSRAMDVM